MGFGTLFIGYFFLLNFAYISFTDAICGSIMLYGLYKLSKINKPFGISAIFAAAFTLLGVIELLAWALGLFFPMPTLTVFYSVSSIVRYSLILFTSTFMLYGMRDVAKEVRLLDLSEKCERLSYITAPIYSANILLEIFGLFDLKETQALYTLTAFAIVITLALVALTLIRIYSCYMRICMPSDTMEEKKSRFSFVNAFRKHEEEKQREYAEYKLQKFKDKLEKKNKGKKQSK